MNDARLSYLEQKARRCTLNEDPSHDWLHVERVSHWCRRIGSELEADLSTLLPGALLHDIVSVRKDHPERAAASAAAARAAEPLLAACGYDRAEIDSIQTIIREHSYSAGHKPSTLESAVLQDADRLDALGAIGVLRLVTCGVRMGAQYYDADEPFARQRQLNDRMYSLDHFFTKILQLPARFNTAPGKREAERRVQFVRQFLDQIGSEIPGESVRAMTPEFWSQMPRA